jgi:hypothetical protein
MMSKFQVERPKNRGSISDRETDFSLLHNVQPNTQTLVCIGNHFLGLKGQEREANYSPPSSVNFKNV